MEHTAVAHSAVAHTAVAHSAAAHSTPQLIPNHGTVEEIFTGRKISLGEVRDDVPSYLKGPPRCVSTYGAEPVEPYEGLELQIIEVSSTIRNNKGGTPPNVKGSIHLYVSTTSDDPNAFMGQNIFWYIDITDPKNIWIRQFESGSILGRVSSLSFVD